VTESKPPAGGNADEQDDDLEIIDEDEESSEREYHGSCPICDAPVYEWVDRIQTTCSHLLAVYQGWPNERDSDKLPGINVSWEREEGLEGWGQPIFEELHRIQQYFAKLRDADSFGVEHARQALLDHVKPRPQGGWLDDVLQSDNPLRVTVRIIESAIEKTPAVTTSALGENWMMNLGGGPNYLWAKRPKSAWKQLSARLDSLVAEAVRIANLVRAQAGTEPEKINEIEPMPEPEPWSDHPILDAHTITLNEHGGFGRDMHSTIAIRRLEESTWSYSAGYDSTSWTKRCRVSQADFQSLLASLVAGGYFAISVSPAFHSIDIGTTALGVEGPTAHRSREGQRLNRTDGPDLDTAEVLLSRACNLVSEFAEHLPWELDDTRRIYRRYVEGD
jgi:hypothetical protein